MSMRRVDVHTYLQTLLDLTVPNESCPKRSEFYTDGPTVRFGYDGGLAGADPGRIAFFCPEQVTMDGEVLLTADQVAAALAMLLNQGRESHMQRSPKG